MLPKLKEVDATQDPEKLMKAFAEVIGKYMQPENIRKAQTVGAPVGPYIYGPGGLFGVKGLERDIISTHTQITGSLGEMIPIASSNDLNPLFPYITGFLRSDQQEKNGVCDDPVAAANFKTCIQTTVFGRKEFKTRQAEINHIGQRQNRGEFHDLNVVNGPLVEQMGGLMQGFFGLQNQSAIFAGREMVMRLVEVGVAYQRWFCPQVYTGNPANNSAGGGYKEFPGLDLLIGTTKIDALTGAACPSLRSDIKDFNGLVDRTTDPDIVRVLTTMMRILRAKANSQGLGPVDLRLVMRDELFYALTEIWPCRYLTYRCASVTPATGLSGSEGSFSTEAMFRMKTEMRTGSFLYIDGVQVPVIIDNCIAEDNSTSNGNIAAGSFGSDIYIVPFSARGGTIRTLYWEHYDYRNDVLPAVGDAHAGTFFWSDGGVFLWGLKAPDNWCIELISKVEPRLILRTPQLAGRLTNIFYAPLQHLDDPLPSQNYFVNGGVPSGRPAPSPYSEWNLSGPGFNS